jgi:excinuclease UvrABC helicase subunit UvrB
MMNTRARAMIALERHDVAKAVKEIGNGCEAIRGFLTQYGRAEEECFELDFLERWGEELRQSGRTADPEKEVVRKAESRTVDPPANAREADLATLRVQLAQAIEKEEYERAAVIRDRINSMEQNQRDSA